MSQTDPASPNAFAAAVQWLDNILLGSIASAIAVIAVASIGFLLLSGRVDVRRAVQVLFGCFVLFGASSIAAGVMKFVSGSNIATEAMVATSPPPTYPVAPAPESRPVAPYDPYAGAAMPAR
jgi:type IV secretory pathway VirB2 component (pilin)